MLKKFISDYCPWDCNKRIPTL